MAQRNFDFNLTNRQAEAQLVICEPDVKEVMYGGAKGGGKSHYGCGWVYDTCAQVVERFKLKPTKKPLHVGWMGRKQAVDFTATTLQTWQRIIPANEYMIRSGTEKHPRHILLWDTLAVDFGGLDKRQDVNKFNSAEYMFYFIDQAEETIKDDVSVLRASLRLTIDGKRLPYKGMMTANPANCWLKDEFILNPIKSRRFVQALPSDNPYLPEGYIQTLKDSFGHRPELLAAYLDGSWDMLDGATQVIKSQWIQDTRMRKVWPQPVKRFIAIDTARFGDDETVIGIFEDTNLVEKIVLGHTKSTEISSRAAIESMKHHRIPIVVEATGGDLGSAVIDELESMGHKTLAFCPQAESKVIDPSTGLKKYYNMRAEAWWEAGLMMSRGFVEWKDRRFPVACPNIDQDIQNQLLQPTYSFRNNKILIESKQQIKDRLQRSPDHADMFVIGLWAFNKLEVDDDDYITIDDAGSRSDNYEPISEYY